ncbi:MAG: hypothetical protein DMD61_04975 [Gemmatimonadetes bacterium]|nr:MAG: hypothetical protein DMD61_04975 [Gemmatimonadota bacterium]
MADIRPMNFGEILDGSLVMYRRHFGLFLKLAVVVLAVPVLLFVYFGARWQSAFIAPTPNPGALLLLFPLAILYYLASLVLTAGTVRIISDAYLGRVPQLQDALALGLSKLWALVAVGLGKGVILFLCTIAVGVVIAALAAMAKSVGAVGVLLLIAAGVAGVWLVAYVLCGYGVTTPVVVLEELGSSFDSFRRSWELTRGFRGKVFGLGVVAFLLFNVLPTWVLQAPAALARLTMPGVSIALAALATIVPVILAPAIAAVITLMYYDLRVRREAFDLQVLGQRLGIV